jgi:hypothetical protein
MTTYLIHTKKPDALVHILDENDKNTVCQLFNNKYVRKSSYYRSSDPKQRKVCKNCMVYVLEDDFADGPLLAEYAHFKSI